MRDSATVLVVEDDLVMLEGLRDLLELTEFEYPLDVLTATNGREGLHWMSRRAPDLVVADIMMPEMDGFEFLETVRANANWAHVPFIFLTARGRQEDIIRGRLEGADLYVTKPFDAQELTELIFSQLSRALQRGAGRRQEIADLKQSLLAILSHEFRTPLTYVTAFADMLAEDMDQLAGNQELSAYLRGIQTGTVRLTRLIEDQLQLLALKSGETESLYKRRLQAITSLKPVLTTVVRRARHNWRLPAARIRLEVKEHIPSLYGDPQSLSAAFDRLLDNAIKFALMRAEDEARVGVTVSAGDDKVYVAFTDNGVGFPEAAGSKLFDLFYQHDRERQEQQGVGAGLTIARDLIALHGGRIEVQGEEQAGATFTVVLPANGAEMHRAPPAESHVRTATVLLVEDNADLLAGVRELLEFGSGDYRLRVLTATNGRQALEVMAGTQPDLIICDIMMPVMDGYELLDRVRRHSEWMQIPFLFLTARGQKEDLRRGLGSVDEYITKPCDVDVLLGLVKKQLDRFFQVQGVHHGHLETIRQSVVRLFTPDFLNRLAHVSDLAQGWTTDLASAQSDAEMSRALRGILRSSVGLNRLVADFVTLVEIRTGEARAAYQAERRVVQDLWGLMLEARMGAAEVVGRADANLRLTEPQSVALRPVASPGQLALILSQLFVAAASYAAPDHACDIKLAVAESGAGNLLLSFTAGGPLPAASEATVNAVLAGDHDSASVADMALLIANGYAAINRGHISCSTTAGEFSLQLLVPAVSPAVAAKTAS